eukprot:comp20969_c0_seq1/m.28064 comp20969_c0_seq1/g.28064  ORF comp20969_c0_seq1/g.28064 comp20969_c0_seq1/m.28064 type:complete len:230 (-) comp20969_c0_seq1:647-1336(-)
MLRTAQLRLLQQQPAVLQAGLVSACTRSWVRHYTTETTTGGQSKTETQTATPPADFAKLFSEIQKQEQPDQNTIFKQMAEKTAWFVKDNPITDPKLPRSRPTHGKQYVRCTMRLQGIDHRVLDSYVEFVRRSAKAFDIPVSGRIALPTHRRLIQVLKSPHVHKKHKELFAKITHNRLVEVYDCSDQTMELFLKYIEDNMPAGVMSTLTEVHHEALPDALQKAIAAASKQ